MKYSIVIPVYKNLELTKKCIKALRLNSPKEIEIVMIDDNSGDGTAEYIKSQKDIVAIINETNRGFAKNCNLGAQKASGDIVVFLNNDTEVHAGWLEAINETFAKNKDVGAVGVKLLFPDGTLQHAGVVISPDKTPRHIYYQFPSDYAPANKEREYQVVTAACVAIPKQIFSKMGGFDEAFRNGLEDVDLCLRLKKEGYKILYNPRAVVTHHESVAPGRFLHNKVNADLYMSRWKTAVTDEHKYYREDGKNIFWILLQDLRSMSYGKDEYGTRPFYVSLLRIIYIPMQKISAGLTYLVKGDFAGLIAKISRRISA